MRREPLEVAISKLPGLYLLHLLNSAVYNLASLTQSKLKVRAFLEHPMTSLRENTATLGYH